METGFTEEPSVQQVATAKKGILGREETHGEEDR